MRVEIRDYRGVERADITLDRVALVAGRNEMGKSCIAEATRAALSGMAIPIHGVLKKDARLLVKDGADGGLAEIKTEGGSRMVRWPAATLSAEGEDFCASDYATGFTHILDLNIKDRSKVLGHYIESAPTKEEVIAAVTDAHYNEAATAKVWDSIESNGWDHTYKRAREYTVTLKGQWQECTGEKYGAKKGDAFRPDSSKQRQFYVDCLATAEQAVLDTAGAVAVSESEIENLKRKVQEAADAPNLMELNDTLNQDRDALEVMQKERAVMPDDPESPTNLEFHPCPECGAALVITGDSLSPYVKPEPPEKLDEATVERRDLLDQTIAEQQAIIKGMEQKIAMAGRVDSEGKSAAARLEEIEKAPKLDEAAVELAKDAVGDARSALADFDARVRAYKLHGDLVKNDLLIQVLAPDGLRKRKLASKLGEFNKRLAKLCADAGWPTVAFDENLECDYGTRRIWAASKSGQWRARAVIQIAMALMDGSEAVIIDEADMLDTRGRNGLFAILGSTQVRALVCMTFSKREKVPLINKIDLGVSYWIENGIAEAI